MPLEMVECAADLVKYCHRIAEIGNKNVLSDVATGALLGASAGAGAAWMVRINLQSLQDDELVDVLSETSGRRVRYHYQAEYGNFGDSRGQDVTAHILDGRAMGAEIRAELRDDVQRYIQERGMPPGLVIVLVGGDAASGVYSKAILRIAGDIGVQASLEQLPEDTTEEDLRSRLLELNADDTVQGIIVQMPLPLHLSQKMVADTVTAAKDIDGISPRSAGNLFLGLPSFLPSTAAAVMEILERTQTPLAGKRVVILGRSNVVGKPLAMMLLQKNATVTVCHSRTPNLATFTRQADVLVAAVGRANMVTGDMVRPGAVVIDVGINPLPTGGIVGDVDLASVRDIASAVTPTPGGVGPLTNVLLLKQCVQAAWQLLETNDCDGRDGEGCTGSIIVVAVLWPLCSIANGSIVMRPLWYDSSYGILFREQPLSKADSGESGMHDFERSEGELLPEDDAVEIVDLEPPEESRDTTVFWSASRFLAWQRSWNRRRFRLFTRLSMVVLIASVLLFTIRSSLPFLAGSGGNVAPPLANMSLLANNVAPAPLHIKPCA